MIFPTSLLGGICFRTVPMEGFHSLPTEPALELASFQLMVNEGEKKQTRPLPPPPSPPKKQMCFSNIFELSSHSLIRTYPPNTNGHYVAAAWF